MLGLQRYPEGFVFRSHGMRISAMPTLRDKTVIDYDIPKGTVVGHVDFTPNGFADYSRRNRRYATRMSVLGINDFSIFLNSLQDMQLDQLHPKFLEGKTNVQMAHYAHRYGFTIQETTRSIFTGKRRYRVVGETDNILAHLEERKRRMEATGVFDRLVEQDAIKPPLLTRLLGSTRQLSAASLSKLSIKNFVGSVEAHTKLIKLIGKAIGTVIPVGLFAHLTYERLIGNEARHRIIYDLRKARES